MEKLSIIDHLHECWQIVTLLLNRVKMFVLHGLTSYVLYLRLGWSSFMVGEVIKK